MQMRHTWLWTSETHENGQKRGGSDEKVQKLWILLVGARAEGRAAEYPKGKEEQEREKKKKKKNNNNNSNNPIIHFHDPPTQKV